MRLSAEYGRGSESFEHESPLSDGALPKPAEDVDEAGAPEAKHGLNAPANPEAAMTAAASLKPDARTVTLGGDDRPMDEEAGLRLEGGDSE